MRPLVIDLGKIALRLGSGQLGPLLPGVKFDQHISGTHRLAGFEIDLLNRAGQVRTDGYALDGFGSANYVQGRWPGFALGDNCRDRSGRHLEMRVLRYRGLNLSELDKPQASQQR